MATRTWLYDGGETFWDEVANWIEGSLPEEGDDVFFTGSVGPTTGPGAITFNTFDTTGLSGAFDGGGSITVDITIGSGGILRIGSLNQTGAHIWKGDAVDAAIARFIGAPSSPSVLQGLAPGGSYFYNGGMYGNAACGSNCVFRGASFIFSETCVVGENASFHETARVNAGTIGPGSKWYGNHNIRCDYGNVVIEAGTMYIYGQVTVQDSSGSYSITFNSTVNAYLMGLNSKITFGAGSHGSWPNIYPVQKLGSQLVGALP